MDVGSFGVPEVNFFPQNWSSEFLLMDLRCAIAFFCHGVLRGAGESYTGV